VHSTDQQKIDFVISELLLLAWSASVQRSNLYKERDGHTQEKNLFRERITEFLSLKVMPLYKYQISEEDHYKNIDALINYAEKIKGTLLAADGYKYGVAQKLLNLALKYYWCLGLIAEPPHCPIDRIVISETKSKNFINWTRITKKSEYEEVIEDVKRLAHDRGLSVPLWELTIYSRR
jgi:hypothetical protein